MRAYEIGIRINQTGSRKNVKVVIHADNPITARDLAGKQYGKKNIVNAPREIKFKKM
jgi:hypothetical protein